MNYLPALCFILIFPGLIGLFLYHQTKIKGRYGLGPVNVRCPTCGTPQPFIRRPASMRQALFGGYTCKACGCEIDKYGRAQEAQQ
jgi:predicted RNA-binding Zn-ribbon protein involved in translation (DUF1610 family)